MTNLEKLIETLQNAPIEKTACFIQHFDSCQFCAFENTEKCHRYNQRTLMGCKFGIKQWLESEAKMDEEVEK